MKKQWKEFLENKPMWAYDIVPSLVQQLDRAKKANDTAEYEKIKNELLLQGIDLDADGNLIFLSEKILEI